MSVWQNRFSLARPTALVPGASSGISTAIAEVFADAGAKIVGQGRSGERLRELGAGIANAGGQFTDISGNLGLEDGAVGISRRALASQERIDILVNSAGVARTGPVTEFDLADWYHTLKVNLTAPFIMSRVLLPSILARRCGEIINVSS